MQNIQIHNILTDGYALIPAFTANPCNVPNWDFVRRFYELNVTFDGIYIGSIFSNGIDDTLSCFGDSPLYGTLKTFDSYQNWTTNIQVSVISTVCHGSSSLTTTEAPIDPTPAPTMDVTHHPAYAHHPAHHPPRTYIYVCFVYVYQFSQFDHAQTFV